MVAGVVAFTTPASGRADEEAAQFTNGKPDDEAAHKTCFSCHEPGKDRATLFLPVTRLNFEEKRKGARMSTIHLHQTTTSTPEQYVAGPPTSGLAGRSFLATAPTNT
jgi:hypothetical protein